MAWHAAHNYYGGFQSFVFSLSPSLDRPASEVGDSAREEKGTQESRAEGSATDSQKGKSSDDCRHVASMEHICSTSSFFFFSDDTTTDEDDDELNTISRTVSAPAEGVGSGVNVYKWSGGHSYFQFSPGTAIAMGGGGGFAWFLDQDLLYGSSGTSQTFANPCLATSKDFKCVDMEVWGLFEPRELSRGAENQ